MSLPAENPDRRSELLAVKLSALVRDHLAGGDDDGGGLEVVPFPPGAAVKAGNSIWALIDDGVGPRLGAALAVTVRQQADALSVIAADHDSAGIIARRAGGFTMPIDVYIADGRTLVPVGPAPLATPDEVPAHHFDLRPLIVEGGAEPIEEWGALVGEVRGLEVCRVVDDQATGATRLEVGVGAHDREAFQMMHGDVPAVDSLARVAEVVATQRGDDAAPHPLNRLAAERRLRAQLIDNPGAIGATELAVEAPPVPRPNLKDPVPCSAFGHDADGGAIVVVCSTGVDLEVIPYAVDARLAAQARRPGVEVKRTVVVTPERDRMAITTQIADQLNDQVELMSIDLT